MRHSRIIVLLALSGAAGSAYAKSQKKPELPRIVCPARYVYVRTMDGDVMRPDVDPEDRQAVQRLNDELREWGRYTLVYQPKDSDLVFVVRTGRLAEVQPQIGVGSPVPPESGPGISVGVPGRNAPDLDPSNSGPGPQPQNGPARAGGDWHGARSEMGPPDDLLAVYAKPGDQNRQSALWQRTMKDGLAAPRMPLFDQLRRAVDTTCQDKP